jgi:short-subunit dehydrogenase
MSQTALITGGSSGIGKELAYLFAKDGYDLVLVARNKDNLQLIREEITHRFRVNCYLIVKDLEDPEAPHQIYHELQQKKITVDFLVNNAGFGSYGEFRKVDLQIDIGMIEVNIKALTVLTKIFLPEMIRQRAGGILNIASTASFQPGPLMAVYYATKAYVLSFTEALANELQGTGVTATAFCPGPTDTGFAQRAKLGVAKLQSGVMDAQKVAQIGYRGFMKKKVVVIPGIQNSLLTFFVRFLPRKTVTGIMQMIQNRRSL